ncbi:putative RNA methylase [Microbacterium sp. AK009]|uniref:DUF6507 family protein n=1 Tax=Microbacterium sp. AK009 TaxID=2723068 RepID=UPI0015CC7370|nr:DUF6507 family protein [Microbacterium sp. AK009]NYF15982.1 putative RNA methylase [Microbacterium sp. AK009]
MHYRVDVVGVADASRATLSAAEVLDEALRQVLTAVESCGTAAGEAAEVRTAVEMAFRSRRELTGAVAARLAGSVQAVGAGTVAFIEADREMVATATAAQASTDIPALAGHRAL